MEIALDKPAGIKIKGKRASAKITPEELLVENYQINGPGEYEVAGIDVIGLPGGVYCLRVDGVSVGYLPRKLSDDERSRLGAIHVAIVPASLDLLDTNLEAVYVIPQGSMEEIEKFAKGLGVEQVTPVAKLSVLPEKLPETTTVVVLG